MTFDVLDILSIVFVLLPLFAWSVAVILWRAATGPVGHERALVAIRDAAISTIVALLGLNRLLGWHWPPDLLTVLFIGVLLAVCGYPLRWLVWYLRGDFEKPA